VARLVTLGALRLACQRRADLEGDDPDEALIVPAEWHALISTQYGELYQGVADVGGRYFEGTSAITATGAASYALPSDHLSTIGVDRILSGGQRIALRPLEVQERNCYAGSVGDASGYEVVGQNVVLRPKPSSGSYELIYVPQPPDLTVLQDTDTVDVVTIDGLEFLVWGVTVKALSKKEGDVRLAMSEREAARARLIEWAVRREMNSLHRQTGGGRGWSGDIHGEWNPASWRHR
jgi:hypothetical protein